MFHKLFKFIREQYSTHDFIPLHEPRFLGLENQYVKETIDSTFVSSVGSYVQKFEKDIARYTDSPSAIATVNGTAALHIALKLADVQSGDLVITQPLTFVATCNAISYCSAEPIFVDVSKNTLGLSPVAVEDWLIENAFIDDRGLCRSKADRRIIRACLPMHTFGHPVELDELIDVCARWHITLIEDAAESLGSFYKARHTGTFGALGTLSFNGNKIITCGGGGMILSNQIMGRHAKHLSTTAKSDHPYEYIHDEIAYNYRLPNLNAALGCAQLEQLDKFINAKRQLADTYAQFFTDTDLQFVTEPNHCRSNYWLNAVICKNRQERDVLLKSSNESGVMTRPIWALMNHLPIYAHCQKGPLTTALWLESCVVNLPSSAPLEFMQ